MNPSQKSVPAVDFVTVALWAAGASVTMEAKTSMAETRIDFLFKVLLLK